jgi:hypothetical protein
MMPQRSRGRTAMVQIETRLLETMEPTTGFEPVTC